MMLDRVAKFGFGGALGIILISLGTLGLMGVAWAERTAGFEGRAIGIILIVWVGGTAVTVLFLFVVIGAFLDRELEARGLDNPEE